MSEIYQLKNGFYTNNLGYRDASEIVETIQCEIETVYLGEWGNRDQCAILRKDGKIGFLFSAGDYPPEYTYNAYPFTKYDRVDIYIRRDYSEELFVYAIAYDGEDWDILLISDEISTGYAVLPIGKMNSCKNPLSYIPKEFAQGRVIRPFLHTPEKITKLESNEIFVFGSNKEGKHAIGAAAYAAKHFGAQYGVGVGRTGQCYAIPTDGSLDLIKEYVEGFRCYAKCHPELTFYVTRIGCGKAGYEESQISPMFYFANEMNNIILPKGW